MEWTPAQIRLFCVTGLYLSQPKFAKELEFSPRTIGNAERGTHPPSLALRRALDQALEQASDTQRNRFLAAVAALQENCAAQDSKEKARDARHVALTRLSCRGGPALREDMLVYSDIEVALLVEAGLICGPPYRPVWYGPPSTPTRSLPSPYWRR